MAEDRNDAPSRSRRIAGSERPPNDGAEASRADQAPEPTLIERACDELREDILSGRLAPGEKLRVEHLRQRYGVGAGTLREAMTRLASDALVEVVGRRGFRVTAITPQDLEDLTRLRLQIEIEALRHSIRNGDAEWRSSVTQAFEELAAVERPLHRAEATTWEELNTRFHEALLAANSSPWTLRILRQLWRHGRRYRKLSMDLLSTDGRDVHLEHAQIFESAIAGNEARAALALEAHICATPNLVIRAWRDGRPI